VRGPAGPSASAPNQDGSGTRCAQTAFAQKVDSGLQLRHAQGGLIIRIKWDQKQLFLIEGCLSKTLLIF